MDGQRFDHLTRILASGADRRHLVQGLLATVLAGFAGRPGTIAAQTCPTDQVRRRGVGCVCRTTGRPPVTGVCPCRSNSDCAAGHGCCNGACIDIATDLANCGACGAVCDLGSGISGCCNGVCTQLFGNEEHCGACDLACNVAANERCSATDCCVEIGGGCASDEECCFSFLAAGPRCCNGICTDLQRDEENCGACGVACDAAAGEVCGGGGTIPGECCQGVGAACGVDDDCCFSPTAFCCNSVCTLDQECCSPAGGTCITADDCCGFNPSFPQLGPACCGGICRDTQRDEANCGTCEVVCTGTGQICGGGGAIPGECCGDSSQNAPCQTDDDCCFNDLCCNNVCTNVAFNEDHCNACFNACDSDEQCRLQGCCGNTGNICSTDAECCFNCVNGHCD